MTHKFDDLISKAERLVQNSNAEAAMAIANELVEQYPSEIKAWRLRAHLHGRNSNYAESVADYTRAIEVDTAGPALNSDNVLTTVDLFFNRGADRFALGDNHSAIDDFSRALDLSDKYHRGDYRDTLHFWRAEALLRLGRKHAALSDLTRVPDGFTFWTDRLRTKADLLADCATLPG
jgi:tetratricopeptide (TPR) repeat protein